MDTTKEAPACPVVSDSGLKCQKRLHWFESSQEYDDHAGGHIFADADTWDKFTSPDVHIDAAAFLAGKPADSHEAKDCTRTGHCAWRLTLRPGNR